MADEQKTPEPVVAAPEAEQPTPVAKRPWTTPALRRMDAVLAEMSQMGPNTDAGMMGS